MASPTVYATLVIPQGTTWQRRWRVSDPDTGTPRDLSEWTARGQIRANYAATAVLFEWTGDGIECDADGYVTVTVNPTDSSAWGWRDGMYDIELIDPAGRVARIAQGAVRVSPEITR